MQRPVTTWPTVGIVGVVSLACVLLVVFGHADPMVLLTAVGTLFGAQLRQMFYVKPVESDDE